MLDLTDLTNLMGLLDSWTWWSAPTRLKESTGSRCTVLVANPRKP